MPRIAALKQTLAAVLLAMDGILQVSADDNNRDFTAEEQTDFDAKLGESKRLQASIEREETVLALKSSAATPVTLPQPTGPGRTIPAAVAEQMPKGGIMLARIAFSLAATGMEQRAAAAHAGTIWGEDMGNIVGNMEQSTNTKGGFLVDTAYSSDFIDVLRPRVVVRKLGARSVPMPDGNLSTRKKTTGSSAGYIGERVVAPSTGVAVDMVTMTAKTLAAIVPITNRLIRRASIGVEQMVRDDLVEGVAVKEDQQFLRGVSSQTAPGGLRYLTAAGNIFAAAGAADLITVTSDLAKLRLKVLNANVPMTSCGYIMSPTVFTFLENIRDANGNKAFAEVAEGRLGIYPIAVTTSVPDNLGAGANESEIYFGDFSQMLIGDTMSITIAASDTAAYDDNGTMRAAFSTDETVIRLIEEHDTALRYDTAFAVLTTVTWKP